ncbi:MAG: regulatory iron-sulfur-containing complex subunit RicT, partial [Chloroflexi bacterium]|nr:regulatory iron-sulfur-containing complex subunit RicT [Chloroflexota bacterium]
VVQTSQGLDLGKVIISPDQVLVSELTEPLKPVLRKATEADFNQMKILEGRKGEAKAKCKELIAKLNLPMKLLDGEWSLDESCLSFLFSAEERVDFRDLVRELTRFFKTRVELRQVGARDEAKIVCGYGRCGLQLCCASHLSNFESVSMKMAKEQDLPLNPSKISGVCGRLLCCLAYESAQYKALKEKLPRIGHFVFTADGKGRVSGGNPLKQTIMVELESKAVIEVPVAQLINQEEHEKNQQQKQQKKDEQIRPDKKVGPG